jgi:hypothetical protein
VIRLTRYRGSVDDIESPASLWKGKQVLASHADNPEPKLEVVGSRQLPQWMHEQRVSFAFTTHQTGKLFLIGL